MPGRPQLLIDWCSKRRSTIACTTERYEEVLQGGAGFKCLVAYGANGALLAVFVAHTLDAIETDIAYSRFTGRTRRGTGEEALVVCAAQ